MILKKKLARAKQSRIGRDLAQAERPSHELPCVVNAQNTLKKPQSLTSSGTKVGVSLRLKNVSKNYGRAICNFILSDISKPYLDEAAREQRFDIANFCNYIQEKRSTINGIRELRSMLLIEAHDSEEEKAYKLAFQRISEIFVKYFAINWIFNSKLEYKLDYVKCRHKMLRRIKNPQLFTYLHY